MLNFLTHFLIMNTMQWMSQKTKNYSKKLSNNNVQGKKSSLHLGSPPPHYMQDEYDFDFDNNDDAEDRFINEDQDESDEDTEEASETDMGKSEYTEIKEQMYQDKLATLKKQLQQLKDGTHPEYNTKLKKLDHALKERLRLNNIWRDYEMDCVERDFVYEKKCAAKEFEEKKIDLREMLISDLEEKRKMVEAERQSMELSGDSMEVKPVMTRKLRRRPNDPVPVPEKRRKPPPAQLNYLLDDKEVESDLRLILRSKPVTSSLPTRKPSLTAGGSLNFGDGPLPDTRIEDGKLLYERRWYHRGQPVYVEGKDVNAYPAVITAIGTEAISVKKTVDGAKFRINLYQLARGIFSIKRRAP
ncbi:hypothetical protein B566_EDAN016498 [Ephemera danica]|nr:hypothetical protein B566_EDAN016498 [Ephemera danica]